jgi:putative superfamily III holin-X
MQDQTGRDPMAGEPEGWPQKLVGLFEGGRRLLATRAAIFREELGEKAGLFGRGLAALILAAAFGGLSLLLFTAWIAALFTKLLGGPVAGILAAFGLYILVAGAAAFAGVKTLARVKPTEFPMTRDELRKDWASIRAAACPEPEPPGDVLEPSPTSPKEPDSDDLEARFRAGAE